MSGLNGVLIMYGYGPLGNDIVRARDILLQVKAAQQLLHSSQEDLLKLMSKLNDDRRKRVLDLLKGEGKAICLLHKIILRDSKPKDWIVLEGEVVVLRMIKSWTESHREYDSDRSYTRQSSKYETTACSACASIVRPPGSFTDSEGRNHARDYNSTPMTGGHEKLYTVEVLDVISEWYQMPIITPEFLST